jgi:hypothetical protein
MATNLEQLLTAGAAVHITAGTIAALLVFPILILGPKSSFHRKLGKWGAVPLAWVIAISGFAMLANPLFTAFWSQEVQELSTAEHNIATFFNEMAYQPMFFLYLDVVLLYLVTTGVGVWARLAARKPDGAVPPRPVDIAWTIAMAVFATSQLVLGLIDVHTESGYADAAIQVAFIMLIIVACDIRTWFHQGRKIRHWWTFHACKLIVAWGGLFYAVLLRHRAQDAILETYETWLVFGWAIAAIASFSSFGIIRHTRRVKRTHSADVSFSTTSPH